MSIAGKHVRIIRRNYKIIGSMVESGRHCHLCTKDHLKLAFMSFKAGIHDVEFDKS